MSTETEILPLRKYFFKKKNTVIMHKNKVNINFFMRSSLKFDPCFLLISCKKLCGFTGSFVKQGTS